MDLVQHVTPTVVKKVLDNLVSDDPSLMCLQSLDRTPAYMSLLRAPSMRLQSGHTTKASSASTTNESTATR